MTPIARIPEAEFWFEDIVYLKVAADKSPGMVTGLTLFRTSIVYEVQWDGSCSRHYGFELSSEYVPDWGQPRMSQPDKHPLTDQVADAIMNGQPVFVSSNRCGKTKLSNDVAARLHELGFKMTDAQRRFVESIPEPTYVGRGAGAATNPAAVMAAQSALGWGWPYDDTVVNYPPSPSLHWGPVSPAWKEAIEPLLARMRSSATELPDTATTG